MRPIALNSTNATLTKAIRGQIVKEETLAKKISEQAKKYKLRANESPEDSKRHDLVEPDERKTMCTAYDKLGWSLAKIGNAFDRDSRTVKKHLQERQRILAQAATYKQEIENHFGELSSIALTIANNLSKYRNTAPNCFRGSDKIGDLVYGGFIGVLGEQSIALQRIDRSIALNLLAHLQKEFSELEEVTDWGCLTNNQITEALILRLNRKGYKGSFKGKCPACSH